MLLQENQIKALGIETQLAGNPVTGRAAILAAQVRVPNAQMRVVAAPVGGMLEMLAVAPGASVKRGQVLAHLASPQALELQRDALQAGSQSRLLQQNLQRDEQLFSEGLIAESRLQATRSAAQQAQMQARERQQGVALAGASNGKLGGPLLLKAPIDGVVLEQGAQLGQRIEAATLIYRIAQLSPLWLEIQAPQEIASSLKEGMRVNVVRQDISGTLIAVGRAVDAASQTVLLRAAVTQGAEKLNPGQVLEVEITPTASAKPENGPITLPASAIVRHQGKTLVFIRSTEGKESRFTARPVRLITQSGERVQVDGVKPDESVVTQGISSLKGLLTATGDN